MGSDLYHESSQKRLEDQIAARLYPELTEKIRLLEEENESLHFKLNRLRSELAKRNCQQDCPD